MKPRLYQFVASPFCAKVRKLLEYKGVEAEIVEVDYLERKELLAASGQIMVPVLTLESGETLVDSHRIAMRLEELYPDPTIFPPGQYGLHLVLANHIDHEIHPVLSRAGLPDKLAHYRRQGPDREAFFKLIRDSRYGAGFCERMVAEREANWDRAMEALLPFEKQLVASPFLTGRIGLADFALYGQLYSLTFTGNRAIPADMPGLHAFFGRMDRISAAPEPPA